MVKYGNIMVKSSGNGGFFQQRISFEAATALLRAAEDGRLASALAPKELEQMRQAGQNLGRWELWIGFMWVKWVSSPIFDDF